MGLPASAAATPQLKFKAQFVPIPGYPETGNIYGAGAALQAEYQIVGDEYVGSPPPLVGLKLYLPQGVLVHTSGFPTCPQDVLETGRGEACPNGSRAGPAGLAALAVGPGGHRIHESRERPTVLRAGWRPGPVGRREPPTPEQLVAISHYSALAGAAGFGPELIASFSIEPVAVGHFAVGGKTAREARDRVRPAGPRSRDRLLPGAEEGGVPDGRVPPQDRIDFPGGPAPGNGDRGISGAMSEPLGGARTGELGAARTPATTAVGPRDRADSLSCLALGRERGEEPGGGDGRLPRLRRSFASRIRHRGVHCRTDRAGRDSVRVPARRRHAAVVARDAAGG